MPSSVDQILQQGIEAHKAGKAQDAERLYRAILQEQPTHPDANYNLGVLAVGDGKPELSLHHFKIALEADPNHAQYWLSMIDTLIKVGQIDNAKKVLQQGQGMGLKGEKVDQLAKQLGAEVKPVLPHPAGATSTEQMEALIGLYNQGHFEAVIKQASNLVEQFPQSIVLFNLLGAANAGLRRFDRAIESYNRALQIEPNSADSHYNLANALQEKGDLTAAIASYHRALQFQPDSVEAHNNLGAAYIEKGDLTAAIECYNRALQIKPDAAEAHHNLGNALQDCYGALQPGSL